MGNKEKLSFKKECQLINVEKRLSITILQFLLNDHQWLTADHQWLPANEEFHSGWWGCLCRSYHHKSERYQILCGSWCVAMGKVYHHIWSILVLETEPEPQKLVALRTSLEGIQGHIKHHKDTISKIQKNGKLYADQKKQVSSTNKNWKGKEGSEKHIN